MTTQPTSPLSTAEMVTFLFTDIEGSTRLWEAHPEGMQDALARHDALMRQAITVSGGTVFKTVGDAFCAAFPAAPDALSAALAGQIALLREPWPEGTPIRVRMALHTGITQERDNDYFGPILNRVARLLKVGQGGQTLVSGATSEMGQGGLPQGATLRDLGMRRLKDLTRPEHIFQLIHPDLPDSFAPLRTLEATPNNLPQKATSFIGRETEIQAVRALLNKTRLLTMAGTGGTGKTRLALQVAAEALDEYPDGAWLVELAPLDDPALVPQTVAHALAIPEQVGRTMTQTLAEQMKKKKVLLVLDNCEHLLDACARLAAALLRSCLDVRVIATSREPLGIAGEQFYRVPSLSLPDLDAARQATPTSLGHYEGVRLFVERAQAVKPEWEVTDTNAPVVARVCYRLDGLPLALELAAARVRSLSIEQIDDRLDNRFHLLTGGDRTALPRQQTLRALVDWSYDLLSDRERTLLSRVSVFAGGWNLPAAEAVCGFEPIEEREVLDLLTSLVDKSLLATEEDEGETRYRMLETVRQYTTEMREASSRADQVQQRHLQYFVALAEQAELELRGPEQGKWLNRLEAEHDNFRAALACPAHASSNDEQFGLRLAGALWRFWDVRGYLGEGRNRIERALAPTAERGRTEEHGQGQRARAKALSGAGLLAISQGDYAAARELLDEALSLFRKSGDKRGIANALNGLGNVLSNQGESIAAWSLYEESLTLRRASGDNSGIASSLNNLGNVALRHGDFSAARSLYEECLTLQRRLGDRSGIADSLYNLGNIVFTLGDPLAARPLLEDSLATYGELGNKIGIANAINILGNVALKQGGLLLARSRFEESLAIYRELGDKSGVANVLEGMAVVFSRAEAFRAAIVLWSARDALRESIGALATPATKGEYQEPLEQARLTLGEEACSVAMHEGRALSMQQAIELALTHPP